MERNNSKREDAVRRKRRIEGEKKKRESLTATFLIWNSLHKCRSNPTNAPKTVGIPTEHDNR